MSDQKDVVGIMAVGIGGCIEGVGLPVVATPLRIAMAEAALTALEAAGYTITRRHGIVHEREEYVAREDASTAGALRRGRRQ